ncbi:MAG: rhodanese-like domain-containing protein [Verrucomicrobiales bacterium]|jgi:rhodanese-related sulfurtransferase|nr:rhodanese-like domain-containing protein [Verrucomicrobiales bacterium]
MKRHLWRLGWLVLAAVALMAARVTVNPLLVRPAAESVPAVGRVTVAELREWRRDGGALTVIDARDRLIYLDGHIAGAINVPRRGFASRAVESLSVAKDGVVVVYCSDRDCTDSAWVAGELARLGFSQVRVLDGGWSEWLARGGEVAR